MSQTPTMHQDGMHPSRVVLYYRESDKVTPFVVWIECDTEEGKQSRFWGHYFASYQEAFADFTKRAAGYHLMDTKTTTFSIKGLKYEIVTLP